MFRSTRLFSTGLALIASGALLTACGGGGGGGGSLPAMQPISPQSSSAATNSVHAASAVANTAPAPCTTQPVKMIQATALTPSPLLEGNTGTFTVCTQYFGRFTVKSGYNTNIVSNVTITPSTPVDDTIYTAQVTVTAGNTPGTTSLTISDKKGNSVIVAVTVAPPAVDLVISNNPPELQFDGSSNNTNSYVDSDFTTEREGAPVVQQFTIENTGTSTTAPLSDSITQSSPFTIAQDNCSGVALAPNSTCTLTIQLLPTAFTAGPYDAELNVGTTTAQVFYQMALELQGMVFGF